MYYNLVLFTQEHSRIHTTRGSDTWRVFTCPDIDRNIAILQPLIGFWDWNRL